MKRFTTFLLAMLLVVALAVPAFATQEEYTLSGFYRLNETLVMPGQNPTDEWYYFDGFTVSFYRYGNKFTASTINFNNAGNVYLEGPNSNDYGTLKSNIYANGHLTDVIDYNIINFGNTPQVVDSALYYLIMLNATPVTDCDGSECPATDIDHNNICDDCGAPLTMSLRSTLLDYAYVHLQNGQGLYSSDDYWLITDNTEGGYTIYLSNEPFTYGISTAVLSSDGTIHSSSVITMESGQNGGRGWRTLTPGTPLPYGNPVESSHDINGFFPGALWEEMEAVTQGAIVAEQIRLNRTMGILALCGVGLVALLMVLHLFGKRSLIFRG